MWASGLARLGLTAVLLPVAVTAAALFHGSQFVSGSRYPLNEQILDLSSIVLVLPFTCALCAVAGARVRRSRVVDGLPRVRPTALLVAALVGINTLVTWLVLLGVMAWGSARAGSVVLDPRLCVVALAEVTTYAALGAGLGLALPAVLGIPLALVLPYVLIAFPPAMNVYWLRHLTYVSTNCCAIGEDLSWRALTGHLVTLGVLLTIGLVLARHGLGRAVGRRLVGPVVVSCCVALGVAVSLVHDAGPTLVQPRADVRRCAAVGRQTLCLWPEHESDRAVAAPLLLEAQRIAAVGRLPMPSRLVEEATTTPRWPAASVALAAGTAAPVQARNIAESFAPLCGQATAWPRDTPDQIDADAWSLWWAGRLGGPEAVDASDSDPNARDRVLARLHALERMSDADRAADLRGLVARCRR